MVILAPKTKTKKKHFVQQKVKVFRASDPVLSVFMWGVNHSVSRREQQQRANALASEQANVNANADVQGY